jgi:pyrroline-5-carboxylate reductase
VAVVRTMPNTPALVGEGLSAMAGGRAATEADLDWAQAILFGVGQVVRVDESDLDAVTGLTGSGPAYLFLVAEALIEAGVRAGLRHATVEAMIAQLMVGSAKLLAERGDPAALRVMVTSPGGTTAAGLAVLEQRATRAAFLDAVAAATARSRELGTS